MLDSAQSDSAWLLSSPAPVTGQLMLSVRMEATPVAGHVSKKLSTDCF